MSKRKSKLKTALPKIIVESVRSTSLSPLYQDRAIKIVQLILHKQMKSKLTTNHFVPIPCAYWKKAICSHYEKILSPLIELHIVERSPYFDLNKRIPFSYRIAPKLLDDEIVLVEFEGERKKSDMSPECRSTVKFMRKLKLDFREAKKIIDDYIDQDKFLEKIEINPTLNTQDSISVNAYNSSLSGKHYSVDIWRKIADQKGLTIIQDGNKYYLDQPDQYLDRKRMQLRISYLDAIYRFQNREFIASRNSTNFRLDSNISSFPSMLLPCFTFGKSKEPLISIDLSNSQFTILTSLIQNGLFTLLIADQFHFISYDFHLKQYHGINYISDHFPSNFLQLYNLHIHQSYPLLISDRMYYVTYKSAELGGFKGVEMAETPMIISDLDMFMELAKNGNLYEFIQVQFHLGLGKEGRDKAKQIAFMVFFSGFGMHSKSKMIMHKLFPTIILLSERFKKKFGNNQFAILLQKKESKIFIDGIKRKLDEAGLDSITKHDSVLCPTSHADDVEKIIKQELGRFFEKFELKREKL